MIRIGDLYFPDGERHFQVYGDDIANYQRPQRDKAFEYVKNWRLAIDVGANVGIFARHFAEMFERVIAVEPLTPNIECIQRNIAGIDNIEIMQKALGDRNGVIQMYMTDKSLGGSFVSGHEEVEAPPVKILRETSYQETEMVTLDSLGLDDVDLLKMDIQGSEVIALRGAEQTIRRCRPVVLIEEKPLGGPTGSTEHIKQATEVLLSFGMIGKERVGADRIYVFE